MKAKLSQNKPRGYWSLDQIEKEIAKYDTLNDFTTKSSSASRALKRFGKELYKEKTKNLKRKFKFYSNQELEDIAKRYRTRIDFFKGDKNAYNQAIRRGGGLYDKITAHMERVGNRYKRFVYIFEFPDKTAYAGLAKDPKQRYTEHMFSGPVKDYMKETGLQPEFRIISAMLDAEEAAELENRMWDEYQKRGWKVLNRIKPGGLGGRGDYKWTDELLKAEISKYETMKDFMTYSNNAYKAAQKRGKEYFQNLTKGLTKIYTKQSPEELYKEASNYKNRTQLSRENQNLYKKLSKRKLLDLFFPLVKNGELEINVDFQKNPINENHDNFRERMVSLVGNLVKSTFPNFNRENAERITWSNGDNSYEEFYDPILKGRKGLFAKYWFWKEELQLNHELFQTLESFFGEDMTFVIDWFNLEFNKDAESITF